VDVSKRDAKVRIRIAGKRRSWCSADDYHLASTTRHILALRDHLIAEQVSCVTQFLPAPAAFRPIMLDGAASSGLDFGGVLGRALPDPPTRATCSRTREALVINYAVEPSPKTGSAVSGVYASARRSARA
jgi:hypothetical protein